MTQRANAVAIVTGHSRGLGAAIATELLERGVRLMGIARSGSADLVRRFGDALTDVELDLADSTALVAWLESRKLDAFVRDTAQAFLVNNAGVLLPLAPLESQGVAAVTRAVVVNVAAPLALSAAFTAATQPAADRRILHISSGAARHAVAGWSVYCATKAALDHHARSVALDKTARLRISSVAPGVIETEMQAQIRASSDAFVPDRHRFVEMHREGRLLSPAAAARPLVDFLLSDSFGSEPVSALR